MKRKAPKWAIQVSKEVCGELAPRIAWGVSKSGVPFGRWFRKSGIVCVFEGVDLEHTRCVLIHELAHHQLQSGRHDRAMYEKVEQLYQKHGVSAQVAMEREGIYPEHWEKGW